MNGIHQYAGSYVGAGAYKEQKKTNRAGPILLRIATSSAPGKLPCRLGISTDLSSLGAKGDVNT